MTDAVPHIPPLGQVAIEGTMIDLIAAEKVDDHGTIVIFRGYEADQPDVDVFFASDHRPAHEIEIAIRTFGYAEVRVPGYMLLLEREAE